MNKQKTFRIAIILLGIMIIGLITSILIYNFYKEDIAEDSFLIIQGDRQVVVTTSELEEMEMITFANRYRNSQGADLFIDYEGVNLLDVLAKYNFSLEDCSSVNFIARDSFFRSYNVNEIDEDNVILTLCAEGAPLTIGNTSTPPGQDGGPIMIIKRNDSYSTNRIKMLYSIELKE